MPHDLATPLTLVAGLALSWLVQSTVLLALGLLAGWLVRKSGPAVQSAVYRTTLVAVLVCPIASAVLTWGGMDGFNLRLPPPRTEVPGGTVLTYDSLQSPTAEALTAQRFKPRLEPTSSRIGMGPAPDAQSQPISIGVPVIHATQLPARTHVSSLVPIAGAALAIWLIGAIILVVRLLVGQRRMSQLRASAVPVEPDVEALCGEVAARLRLTAPRVLRSPFLFSPCLDGLRRPAILLPDDAADNLRDTFVHELAHLARRDGLWNLLRRSAVAVLWVQPLLWVLSRRLEATAEEVCDDYVVQHGGDRARYAGHLLELAGRALPPIAITGVGMISLRSLLAHRVMRILDSSRSLSLQAGRRVVAASLVVGLAGTVFAGLLGVGGSEREAKAQTPPKTAEAKSAKKKADDKRTVRGQVIDPEGKPVPGATVVASRSFGHPDGLESAYNGPMRHDVVRTVAGNDGKFELGFDQSEPDPALDPTSPAHPLFGQIVVMAPGFVPGFYEANDRQIRLSRDDVPVTGTLVDLEGRPIADATVRISRLYVPDPEARLKAEQARGPYRFPMNGSRILDGEPLFPEGFRTDVEGRFRIDGIGRGTLAVLAITGPKIAFKRVEVVARTMDRVKEDWRRRDSLGFDEPGMYGAKCTIVTEPAQPIEGVVRDAETREPIPGAIVTVGQVAGSELMVDGFVSFKTDAQGRYRLTGTPKSKDGKGHLLAVYPPLDRPYFVTRRLGVGAQPGLASITFDIALRRGTWIEGNVTDLKTGKPAHGSVDYFPFLSNIHAKGFPNFDPKITAWFAIKTRHRTDREGRYRVVGLPGRGVVTVRADDRSFRVGAGAESIDGRNKKNQIPTYNHIFTDSYQLMKEVNVPEGAAPLSCALKLDPGDVVTVKLVDPAGVPVSGTTAHGRFPIFVDHGDSGVEESTTRIAGLEPNEHRNVMFKKYDGSLGAALEILPGMPKTTPVITLTLRPVATLTGRLVDEDGKPVRGLIRIGLESHTPGHMGITAGEDELNAEGRFRANGIPPGGKYWIQASGRYSDTSRRATEVFRAFDIAHDLTVEPGQTIDLGTFDVNTGKRVEAVSKVEAKK